MANRQLSATMYQNLGTNQLGSSISLTGKIKDIGSLVWNVEKELTKCLPGAMSLTVVDLDGSIANWVKYNAPIASGVLPPFVVISYGGVQKFVGIANPSDIQADISDKTVSIGVKDWSTMLNNITLDSDGWKRQDAVSTVGTLPAVIKKVGRSVPSMILLMGNCDSRVYFDLAASSWPIMNGSIVSVDGISGQYVVTNLTRYVPGSFHWDNTLGWVQYPESFSIELPDFSWVAQKNITHTDNPYNIYNLTFDKIPDDLTSNAWYTVRTDVVVGTATTSAKIYAIPVDTTDGLTIGDVIESRLVNASSSYTISDIDSENLLIYSHEAISSTIAANTKLYLSDETRANLVFQSAKKLISMAASGYDVDFSDFTPAQLPSAVFHWLGFKATNDLGVNVELRSPWDVQPGFTDLQVQGISSKAWSGNPDTSYTLNGSYKKSVIWTGQLSSAPTYLMPAYTNTLTPSARRRNRSYINWQYRDQDNGNNAWTPALGATTAKIITYDYAGYRRLTFTGIASVSYQTWNGSVWSSASTIAYPLASKPSSAVPFPGTTSSLGTGKGIMVLTEDNKLNLMYATTTATALQVNVKYPNGVLVNTRNGVFLVTQTGYGLIKIVAGAITMSFCQVGPDVFWVGKDFAFLPNTLATLDSTNIYMMATLSTIDLSSGINSYETHLYQLPADPTTIPASATSPILMDELICEGLPRISMGFTHPDGTRIIGMIGGQLYEVSKTLPEVIQRVNPSNMKALELIEHVCQAQNAMAIACLDKATLRIVSRRDNKPVYSVSVNKGKSETTSIAEDCYSVFVVTGEGEDTYGYAYGMDGRDILQNENVPTLHSSSHCYAVALSYANFYGKFRMSRVEDWINDDPSAVPIWEQLEPMDCVRVNSGVETWYLMGCSSSFDKNRATVKLLQAL